jgi:ATP-dependent DNA helicase RecQ
LGRTLLQQGLLDETTDGYPVLKLNARSWEVLRKQQSVLVAIAPQKEDRGDRRSQSPVSVDAESLFQRLRALRKKLADERAIAPYMVFADSTLKSMAQQQPQTLAEFAAISGVGSRKLLQYGDKFLTEIHGFRSEQGLPVVAAEETPPPPPTTDDFVLAETLSTTLTLFQKGFSVAEISKQRGLRANTILSHLVELIGQGHSVELDTLVTVDHQEKIRAAIATVGATSLTLIRNHLGEEYTYDEIKLVRADWNRSQG